MPEEVIPIVFFLVAGTVGLTFSPIGRAIARRIGGGKMEESEVAELRAEIADLRERIGEAEQRVGGELDEIHGRLDFAERVVAQQRQRDALPGGG